MSREFLTTITAVGGLGATAVKSFVRVPKNHRGIRTFREDPVRKMGPRKGQLRKALGAGIHPVVPWLGGVRHYTMQKCPDDLPSFSVESESGKLVGDAGILWHVKQHEEPLPQVRSGKQELKLKRIMKSMQRQHTQQKSRRLLPAVPAHQSNIDHPIEPTTQKAVEKEQVLPDRQRANEDQMDLYRALFLVKDDGLDNFVRLQARACILSAVGELGPEEAMIPNRVYEHVIENNGGAFSEYGIALDAIYMNSLSRSEAQVIGDTLGHPQGTPEDKTIIAPIITLLPDSS